MEWVRGVLEEGGDADLDGGLSFTTSELASDVAFLGLRVACEGGASIAEVLIAAQVATWSGPNVLKVNSSVLTEVLTPDHHRRSLVSPPRSRGLRESGRPPPITTLPPSPPPPPPPRRCRPRCFRPRCPSLAVGRATDSVCQGDRRGLGVADVQDQSFSRACERYHHRLGGAA